MKQKKSEKFLLLTAAPMDEGKDQHNVKQKKPGKKCTSYDHIYVESSKVSKSTVFRFVYLVVNCEAGSDNLFCKGLGRKYLMFGGHTISVTTIQLCHCNMKAATGNMYVNECGCVPVKLYSPKKMVAAQI